jgi:TolB protein
MHRIVFTALLVVTILLTGCQIDASFPNVRQEVATAAQMPAGPLPTATVRLAPSPTATQVATPSPVDELLARSAANSLLTALVVGNGSRGLDTWLTARARQTQAPAIRARLKGDNLPYDSYKITTEKWVAEQVYQVEAILVSAEATEQVSLRIVQQEAEWLVDELTFAGPIAIAATKPQVQPTALIAATPRPRPSPTATATTVVLAGKLAFMTSPGGPIYVINTDGSRLRQVGDGLDPMLSPDGSRVAFARWRAPGGIYTVVVDGSPQVQADERAWFLAPRIRHPAWSPDGKRIVFSRELERRQLYRGKEVNPGRWGLLVINLESQSYMDLPTARFPFSPSWSTDGQIVVYDGGKGLDTVDMAGNRRSLTTEVGDGAPAWSPVGNQIAFQAWQHDHSDIMLINADGGGRRALTSQPLLSERQQNNVSPAWSPDGKHIAFVTDRRGRWEIWVMNADGSDQRPLFGDGLPGGVSINYGNTQDRMISWGP